MKKLFRLFTILYLTLPFAQMQAQSPSFGWAKGLTTLQNPFLAGFGTQQVIDASGNIYSTGYFIGTHDFDPGSGTFLLTSTATLNIYILKLDSAGNFLWARGIGGESSGFDISDYGYGVPIAVDPDGNVYLTGFFNGTTDFDPGPGAYNLTSISPKSDIFVLKLDGGGIFKWAKQTGSEAPGTAKSLPTTIALDDSGSIYITGSFTGMVDFDPGSGIYSLGTSGIINAFVLKLDFEGQLIWAKAMGGTSNRATGLSIGLTSSDEIVLCGYFSGTIDVDPGPGTYNLTVMSNNGNTYGTFMLKLNVAGDFIWAKSWSGNKSIFGFALKVNASDEIYMVGLFESAIDFDPGPGAYNLSGGFEGDIFVLKLSADGQFNWVRELQENVWINRASGPLALDIFGNLYLTGFYVGPNDFDPGPDTVLLSSNNYTPGQSNYTDLFLLSLNAAGDFRWVGTIGGPGEDKSKCVVTDHSGNIYFTGVYNKVVDFDPGPIQYNLPMDHSPTPANDVFIAKWQQTTVPVVDTDGAGIMLYPNPITDILSIQFRDKPVKMQVEIFGQDGKLIHIQHIATSNEVSIPFEAPTGVYFVRMQGDNGLQTVFKVVKK